MIYNKEIPFYVAILLKSLKDNKSILDTCHSMSEENIYSGLKTNINNIYKNDEYSVSYIFFNWLSKKIDINININNKNCFINGNLTTEEIELIEKNLLIINKLTTINKKIFDGQNFLKKHNKKIKEDNSVFDKNYSIKHLDVKSPATSIIQKDGKFIPLNYERFEIDDFFEITNKMKILLLDFFIIKDNINEKLDKIIDLSIESKYEIEKTIFEIIKERI